jgi:hypothetical protein
MVRAYKPAKLNFNRIVLAIAVHVNCPGDRDADIIDTATRHEATFNLLTNAPSGHMATWLPNVRTSILNSWL